MFSNRLRLLSALAGLCGVALTGIPSALAAPVPAVPPQAQADPSTSLISGQLVQLKWSGVGAGPVDVRECSRAATALSRCETKVRTTGAGPSGWLTLPVTAGAVSPHLRCDITNPCSLFVIPSGQSDLTGAARTPIHFSTGQECPTSAGTLKVAGAPSADAAIRAWTASPCTTTPDAVIWTPTARPTQSSDLTVTERPLSDPTLRYAPLTLSATTFAYDLHDAASGHPITDLRLTPSLLAQILTGAIQSWSDPAIAALNPGHTLPATLTPLIRSDPTWAAYAVTSWLAHVAPTTWTAGPQEVIALPVDGALINSETAVTRALHIDGAIGALDRRDAQATGLPTLTLIGARGDVTASDSALVSSFAAMTLRPDGFRTPSWSVLDRGGWPLPDLAQVAVTASGPSTTGPQADALGRLLVLLAHGSSVPGYAPLPQSARSEVTALASDLAPDNAPGAAARAIAASPATDPPGPPAVALPPLELPSASSASPVEAPIVAPALPSPSPSPSDSPASPTAPEPARHTTAIRALSANHRDGADAWLFLLAAALGLASIGGVTVQQRRRARRTAPTAPVIEVEPTSPPH